MRSIRQTDLKNTLGRILLMALVVVAPALVGRLRQRRRQSA